MTSTRLIFFSIFLLSACSTLSTDPRQNAINTTGDSCKSVGAAIQTLDSAVVAGAIKKVDAQKALTGLVAANAGCQSALFVLQSSAPAAPAAPASSASGV